MAWWDRAPVVADRIGVRCFHRSDVVYTPPGGDAGDAFSLQGVYDSAHEAVDVDAGVPVDTIVPVLGVHLPDFPTGVEPEQGASIVFGTGERFLVRSVQKDEAAEAGALLELEELAT